LHRNPLASFGENRGAPKGSREITGDDARSPRREHSASAVERAIAEVLAEGRSRTPDLGNNAGTAYLGAAIPAAIR
jgi:hypothetical protein